MALVPCVKCGKYISDKAEKCPKCDTKQKELLRPCTECAQHIPPDSKECPLCGCPEPFILRYETHDEIGQVRKENIAAKVIVASSSLSERGRGIYTIGLGILFLLGNRLLGGNGFEGGILDVSGVLLIVLGIFMAIFGKSNV